MAEKGVYVEVNVSDSYGGDIKEFLIGPKYRMGSAYYGNRLIIRTKDNEFVAGVLRNDCLLEVLLPLVDQDQLCQTLKKLGYVK